MVLGEAVDWVRNVDAESLKYCDGLLVQAPDGGNFAISQKYPTTPLAQSTAHPSISVPNVEKGWGRGSNTPKILQTS